MQELSNLRNISGPKSNTVNFLSTGLGAKLAAAHQQRARLRYEHPAIVAADHLCGSGFARRLEDTPARRSQQSLDQAKRDISNHTVDQESD